MVRGRAEQQSELSQARRKEMMECFEAVMSLNGLLGHFWSH